MCGITGFTGQADKGALERMTQTLRHRGPDGEGFFVDGKINLGMRRLAVIDLETGDQPVLSENKQVAVIFNGEIYNFKQLRSQLAKKHRFASQSDTEVIAHGYEEWGERVFERLNGMFAIAIWDGAKEQLILGRDRLGQKPLYYYQAANQLLFASEPKALFQHPGFNKKISLDALGLYLSYEYVPTPLTIFEGMYKLPPGHYLIWRKNQTTLHKYWDIDFARQRKARSLGEAVSDLDAALDEAVRARLVSDVPLGVFLSGGLDSGTIAYYAQKNSADRVKTFSVGFSDKSFDESDYAREVAGHLGTEHFEKQFGASDVLELLPEVVLMQDEPFGDASLLPTHLLSKFAREHVTVALAGDGGDELLYGYPTFQMHKISQHYFKLPKFVRDRVISPLIQSLPASFNNITLDYGLKRFDVSTDYEPWQRDLIWIGSFSDKDKAQLLSKQVLAETDLGQTFEPLREHLVPGQQLDFLDQISRLYLKTYLVDDILYKADRASMYASLEARDPFMDHRLIDLAVSLIPELKMRGLRTKYVLKKMMKGRLPARVVNRKKKGFGMPVAKWLMNELKPLVEENILDEQFIKQQGFFEHGYLKQLWEQHRGRVKDNRKELWTLLMFQLWYKNWIIK